MPKLHKSFHSTNGKRLVLVADDEPINREMLGMILEQDYEVLYARDGEEALDLIQTHHSLLSLVLLDLIMPKVYGMDVLKQMHKDPELSHIPVIVLTADSGAEVESLTEGAVDFIPKPYPRQEVILARVQRTIELSEDREIIQVTERDSLTGLYNPEFFFRYCDQYDLFHKDADMDAIIVDINHFHMVNERYGRAYGNVVLKRVGQRLKMLLKPGDGIVCRREADHFLVYCPHIEDPEAFLERAGEEMDEGETGEERIRLRMGVYPHVDKEIDIERRFDHAKHASDSVRGNLLKPIGFYDDKIHEAELFEEQLLEDFQNALDHKQFLVYYQPKYNIMGEEPYLTSAEALVRWQHPRLGMINPGIFIPLFEANGLIQKLDRYVWRETAAQIRRWIDEFGVRIPVSVNVSRVDLYEPRLEEFMTALVEEYGLETDDLLLEITESAYTGDAKDLIKKVGHIRASGFKIEMDDFGTGYSSLSMVSELPIDALKLDMTFIRNAFSQGRNVKLMELVIDIAHYLKVPVVAEGVETKEQIDALKSLGCEIVQGYYFSRPVPAKEFEQFIKEK